MLLSAYGDKFMKTFCVGLFFELIHVSLPPQPPVRGAWPCRLLEGNL